MHFTVITLFPDMFSALEVGITGRAKNTGKIGISCLNPRDFTDDPNKRIDDRPYGGGPGMVMEYLPLHNAITAARANTKTKPLVIYLSPQGTPLTQKIIRELAMQENIILIAGRYEGIDERVIEKDIDAEYSIGDYVLSGGELPAMVLIEAITRLLPGALGDAESAAQDSFENDLLDHPHYTRPEEIDGMSVPAVLLSGDHRAIKQWRHEQSIKRTRQKRPDLIKSRANRDDDRKHSHEQTHS